MINSGYRGVHLESNFIRSYNPVGVLGTSVYQTAYALRKILLRHQKSTNSNLSLFLAIPQANHDNTAIDWYADPILSENNSADHTPIVNWQQASLEEKKAAFAKLQDFEQAIEKLSSEFRQESKSQSSDLYTFSQLLPKILYTPSLPSTLEKNGLETSTATEPVHIFLVGKEQFPVLTFWGFSHPNASPQIAPLEYIAQSLVTPPVTPTPTAVPLTAASLASEPTTPTQVNEKISWWRWLRWLLLALLLFSLLFFLLRGCSVPSMPPPTLPALSAPNPNNPPIVDRTLFGMKLPQWAPNWVPSTGTLTAHPTLSKPSVPTSPNAIAPALAASTSTAISQNSSPPESPPPSGSNLTTSDTPHVFGPELAIPPQSANQAVLQYLDGNWQASAIQDEQTGRSVRLQYALENGEGTVAVQQSNGTQCTGSVQAVGKAAGLIISNTSQAQCNDGNSYEMPQVECRLNAKQETECFGRYDRQVFPISMRQTIQ